MISLRKPPGYTNTLVYGKFEPYLAEVKNLLAYLREADKKLLIVANYQSDTQRIKLPSQVKSVLLSSTGRSSVDSDEIELAAYEFLLLELRSCS